MANKFLLIIIGMILCLSSFVYAVEYIADTGYDWSGNSALGTDWAGVIFDYNNSITITSITKMNGGPDAATQCAIFQGGSKVANGTYIGDICILNASGWVSNGTYGRIGVVSNQNGLDWTDRVSNPTVFPVNTSIGNFMGYAYVNPEIIAGTTNLYCVRYFNYTISGSSPASSVSVNLIYPINNTINNSYNQEFRFNYTYNESATSCSLFTNETGSWVLEELNSTANPVNTTITMYHNFTSDGIYLWNVGCNLSNGSQIFNDNNFTLIIDTILPSVSTNYINNSIFYKNNIIGQFNFSDEHLWSINITLDNVCIFNITNLSTTLYSYNMSYDISSLSGGWHYLNATIWDGHTAKKINPDDFNPGNGLLFKNKLVYNIKPNKNKIQLYLNKSSIFDEWSYEIKKDRIEEIIKPNKPSSIQTIIIESDIPMYIYESKKGDYGGKWLIIGDKWKDFVIKDEPEAKIDYIQLSSDRKTAEVKISGIKKHPEEIHFSSTGDLNVVSVVYGIWVADFTWMQNATQNITGTGDTTTFYLYMNLSNFTFPYSLISAKFRLNETLYSPNKYIAGNYTYFSYSKFWNNDWGNSTGINYTWNWFFNITNSTVNYLDYNTSLNNITVYQLDIDDCSTNTHPILNFSLFDETYKTTINGTVETDLSITAGILSWYYNNTFVNQTNMTICIPDSFANSTTNYLLSSVTRYFSIDHAVEFHYLDNIDMIGNGTQHINLYTINTDVTLPEYSTSFLLNYLNKYYIPESEAIADLLRRYIGDGTQISVEHGKFDDNGNTVLHLVAEDILYQIIIRKDGEIIYTSGEFSALCQTTPCQINLVESSTIPNIFNYTKTANLVYTLSLDRNARTVTAVFATDDGSASSFNLDVVKYDAYNNISICDTSVISSGGTLVCTIPITAANSTYFTTFDKDSSIVRQAYFDLRPVSTDIMGYTSIIMTIFLLLTLIFMAISSGAIGVIIFLLIGLVISGMLNILTMGHLVGVGSTIMWGVIAGFIIIFKAYKTKG